MREASRRLLQSCEVCEHRCGVDRFHRRGVCGLGPEARAYRAFLHHGEEPEVSPTFAIFLTGCSFRCAYCSDHEFVDRTDGGTVVHAEDMAARVAAAARGVPPARTVSFVGGNPDENLPALLPLLDALRGVIPVVWNSNLYLAPGALDLLRDRVDVMIPDLKFGNDACAAAVARVPRYTEVLHRNLRAVHGWRRRLVVRHLLMPGHVECCLAPAASFVARELPGATLHLLTQYEPLFAGWPLPGTLGGRPGAGEIAAAVSALGMAGATDALMDGRPVREMVHA